MQLASLCGVAAITLVARTAGATADAGPNPCDDFYAYACDAWIASHPIPADRSSWDPYYELAQQNDDSLRALLEGR